VSYWWTVAERFNGTGLRRMGGEIEEESVEVEVIVGWDTFIGPETVEPVWTGFIGPGRADHDGRWTEKERKGVVDCGRKERKKERRIWKRRNWKLWMWMWMWMNGGRVEKRAGRWCHVVHKSEIQTFFICIYPTLTITDSMHISIALDSQCDFHAFTTTYGCGCGSVVNYFALNKCVLLIEDTTKEYYQDNSNFDFLTKCTKFNY